MFKKRAVYNQIEDLKKNIDQITSKNNEKKIELNNYFSSTKKN